MTFSYSRMDDMSGHGAFDLRAFSITLKIAYLVVHSKPQVSTRGSGNPTN